MYKIMIVEDDVTIRKILKESLCQWGFNAFYIEDFNQVLKSFIDEKPHLILMDVTLPFYNGYYWTKEIRKYSKLPIIFISSNTGNMDMIMAMNMGGDDYITKPFELDFVIAKVQALLRRSYEFITQTSIIEHEGLILNLLEGIITYQNQSEELTKNELKIIQLLLENKGNIVSRDKMMVKLWNSDCYIDDNTLTVNVNRLRKKIEKLGLMNFVKTKKGMGYDMITS